MRRNYKNSEDINYFLKYKVIYVLYSAGAKIVLGREGGGAIHFDVPKCEDSQKKGSAGILYPP